MSGRPLSIPDALAESAERQPDAPSIDFEGQHVDYAGLHACAQRWASAIRAWGLQRGERVALFLENGLSFVGAYLGAQIAGATVVLVNTQYRQVELRHILADAAVRLCIVDLPRRAELARVVADLVELEGVVVAEATPDELDGSAVFLAQNVVERTVDEFLALGNGARLAPVDPDEIALIAYTSGTTGRSKGAMLTHRNLVSNAAAVTTAWRWTNADRLLLTLPLFHVHGLGVGLHGSLLVGGSIDLRRRFEAADVYEALLTGGPTMFFGVPTMYTRLIAEAKARSQRPKPLRLYVSGSAPLSVQTFEEFEQIFGQRILERYGMSETIMNLTNPYHGERRPGTVGQPFPGQEARIVEVVTREPIEDERLGEIQVRGPHLFKGYWQQPEATADAFDADGWFNTGDLGWRSADGYFTISGRARELIITGGYNVYPREVEEVLQTHPGVAEAAVLGMPDPEFGEQVVAAIVRRPEASEAATEESLIAYCRDQLASYKKPRRIEFVETLPRNALGKLQKHILKEQLG